MLMRYQLQRIGEPGSREATAQFSTRERNNDDDDENNSVVRFITTLNFRKIKLRGRINIEVGEGTY